MYAGGPGGDPTMGLMGNVLAQPGPMSGLMGGAQVTPQNMGPWSQLAYNMAGRPNQGFSGLTLPPASTAATSPAGGGATALGGTALGILGALGKAAGGSGSTASNLGNAISGLMGGTGPNFGTYTTGNIGNVGNVAGNSIASAGAASAAPYTTGLLGAAADEAGAAGIAPVGTDAISGAADAAASATYPGLDAGGLLGADATAGADAGATAAADAGTTAAADTGATAGADAGAGAAAGLGPALGAASGVAAVLAPAIIGMSTPAYSLGSQWYNNFQNSLNQAKANGTLYSSGIGAGAATSGDPREIQMLLNAGFTPQDIAALQYKNPNAYSSGGNRNVGYK